MLTKIEVLRRCQKNYESRQKAKGYRIRTFRLNNEEWNLVKSFIKKIRKSVD